MFARLAARVDRHAGLVVAAWLVATVVVTATAPSLTSAGTADQTAFVPASAPSGQADALLRREFPDDPTRDPAVIVLARRSGLTAADRAYIASLSEFLASPAAAVHVKAVQTAATAPELAPVLRSADGAAELVIVSLRATIFTESGNRAVAFLRQHVAGTAPAGLDGHVTGLAALATDQADAILNSFHRTAVATVVLVLVILLLVYRSALAPLISLLSIGCAFLLARGVAGYLAEAGVKVASLVETFMVVMAFGAGTDYCLFVISRVRENRGDPGGLRAGVQKATAAVGPVIAASAATVTIGFFAFLAAELGLFRSFGPALGLAIAVTLAAGLTLTPALLRLAGPAAFWPSPMSGDRHTSRARWERVAQMVGRRPAVVLAVGTVLLALPALGVTRLHQSFDILSELPAEADARQGFETLSRHYPAGLLAPVYLVVSADRSLADNDRLAAVDRLTDALRAAPGVAEVRSITQPAGAPLTTATISRLTGGSTDLKALGLDPDTVDLTPLLTGLTSPRGLRIDADLLRAYPQFRERLGFFLGAGDRTTRIVVALEGSPYSRGALEIVRHLDDRAGAELAGGPLAGARLAVAGPSAFFADIEDLAGQDLRTVGALVIGAILVILAVLLRSVVAPLYLLLSVLLSLLATMGICVGVFQGLLGQPGLAFWLPPFLFVILVALGADYNIFIAGRIREEIDAGRTVADAATEGLVLTGGTITSAGFILAGTFGALLITPIPAVRQIGFGVGIGVLLDTFVVRTLLVPATVVLLGRSAFWPSTAPAANPARRKVAVGFSGAGIALLAIALAAVGLSGRPEPPVLRVAAAGHAGAPQPAAGTAAPTTTAATVAPDRTATPATPTATLPTTAGAAPATASTTRPTPTGTPPSGPASTAPPAAPSTTTATGGGPPASGTAARPPANSPGRVAIPALGDWRYHVEGTRRIGLAGSTQPFNEDATTQVSRVGGDDQTPELRLLTQSSSGTVDERRRYAPTAVDLLSLQVASGGLSYGGTFTPPQLLLRWPVRIGDRWRSDWTTDDTKGTTTVAVTAQRTVTVAGQPRHCFVVDRDTTLTGAIEGTQRQRSCWAPDLGMIVEDDQDFQGTYHGVRFEGRAHFTLIGAP
ncbi:MAG TPA: MMPL family transporter [Acidimicrobiia bacterium]|nr:MMPL family transporter [Acidimicrobiia bacterium]